MSRGERDLGRIEHDRLGIHSLLGRFREPQGARTVDDGVVDQTARQPADGKIVLRQRRSDLDSVTKTAGRPQIEPDRRPARGRGELNTILIQHQREVVSPVHQATDGAPIAAEVAHLLAVLEAVVDDADRVVEHLDRSRDRRIEDDDRIRAVVELHVGEDAQGVTPRRLGARIGKIDRGVPGETLQLDVILVVLDHEIVRVVRETADRRAATTLVVDLLVGLQAVIEQLDRFAVVVDDRRRARRLDRQHGRGRGQSLHRTAGAAPEVEVGEGVSAGRGRGLLDRARQPDDVGVQTHRVISLTVEQLTDRAAIANQVLDLLPGLELVLGRDDPVVQRIDRMTFEPLRRRRGGSSSPAERESRSGARQRRT